ncbi:MAG: hypothetical protein EHM34_07195 [Nitrosopumilales archaeon]|nr:MAG: hypothetical protein EHM34_07195 [Nitrosopumilales archaeon]
MTTSLDEVCDLFLGRITDYRLTTLYTTSGSGALNTYLEPYLLDAIDEFDVCDQALVYSTSTQTFSVTLTSINKNMLSFIMVKYWLAKEIRDINQMRLHLFDRDYKTFAEANNLKTKIDLYTITCEEVSNKLTSYGYKRWVTWDDWDDQDFR